MIIRSALFAVLFGMLLEAWISSSAPRELASPEQRGYCSHHGGVCGQTRDACLVNRLRPTFSSSAKHFEPSAPRPTILVTLASCFMPVSPYRLFHTSPGD